MDGSAEFPMLEMDNDGAMYFKPTCVCTVTQRHYGVKNLSKVPLCFEWKMKHADSEVLRVEPTKGIIYPNERQVC